MPSHLASTTRLRTLVSQRATTEGRTDSACPGLRFYRFSAPTVYRKVQVLVPGIVLVLQGSKQVALDGGTLRYDPRHCLVLGGEAVCHGTVVSASSERPYLAIHLDLPPETLVKSLIALAPLRTDTADPPLRENFVSPVDEQVLDAMARLLAASDTELDRQTIAPLVIEEIVLRLLRSDAAAAIRNAASVTRSASRIQQSMRFMRTAFQQALSVEQLARKAAMSPSHYAHSFRAVAGVSPMRYLRDLRLDEARELLLRGGLRVGSVAAQVGFESSAHFSREFKSRFEASPAVYAKRMRDISSGSQ